MSTSLLDTTILSNFAHVRRPDLVSLVLGDDVAIPPAVLFEIQQGEQLGFVPSVDWTWLRHLTLTTNEQILADSYADKLDRGEAECLSVAVTRNYRFLTDDLAARRLAQKEGVIISGTIGLLLRLVQEHDLAVIIADSYLEVMRQHGYRTPVISITKYLLQR